MVLALSLVFGNRFMVNTCLPAGRAVGFVNRYRFLVVTANIKPITKLIANSIKPQTKFLSIY